MHQNNVVIKTIKNFLQTLNIKNFSAADDEDFATKNYLCVTIMNEIKNITRK
tara:strand:+ start:399 stop:554 length:156 start_codon:yes stop_codon:yes gene_type:complete